MDGQKNFSNWISILLFLGIAMMTMWLSSPNVPQKDETAPRRIVASSTSKMKFRDMQRQKTVQRYSPFETKKVRLNFHQLKSSSLQFSKMNIGKEREDDLWMLPQGTELIAVIDRRCITKPSMTAQMSSDSLSNRLANKTINRAGLKAQAYGFKTDRDLTIDELNTIAVNDPCLIGISENGRVQAGSLYTDPSSIKQLHIDNIQVKEVENFFYKSSLVPARPVVMAVIDTGVDYKHVDLAENIWSDSQGRHGYDFVNDDSDPMDDNFHGTHVAGLAAAVGGNDVGVSGVFGTNIKIMVVKILDSAGDGSYADVANGIRWAVQNGADLINLSLSGPGQNSAVGDALIFAVNNGVPVFISAGNNGIELNDSSNFRTPTSFGQQLAGVITVGSIDSQSSLKSSFSNYSPEYVELAAPGSNGIHSTLPDNKFGDLEGTSMATPIAAGAGAFLIAALKAKNHVYTAAEVEDILRQASPVNSDLIDYVKEGRQLNLLSIKDFLHKNIIVQLDGGIYEE